MERHLLLGLGLLAIVASVPCFFFGLRAAYHFFSMIGHRKTGASGLAADLVPFFAPLMPQQFTDQGNVHRRAFLRDLNWALVFGAFIAIAFAVLGIGGGADAL
jgi:hypothetical protein